MTKKQKKFADEYLVDTNATQAAIRAGYSKNTAYSQGQRLLKDVEVQNYIKTKAEELHDDTIADAEEVMKYLTSVLRGETKDEVLRFVGDGYQEKTHLQVNVKDRTKAAELLGKRYGIFTDKVNLEVEPVVIVNDLKD